MGLAKLNECFSQAITQTKTCIKHGEYQGFIEIRKNGEVARVPRSCPLCREELEQLEKTRKERQYLESWRKKLGNAEIPQKLREKGFDDFFTGNHQGKIRALRYAKTYAQRMDEVLKTGQCILFYGSKGTGKTHLAAAIGMHFISHRKRVLYTTVTRMLRQIRKTWKKSERTTEEEAVNLFTTPDLLILDEIGKQHQEKNGDLLIFDIFNQRYDDGKPSVLISNKDKKYIDQYLTEEIVDRIREGNGKAFHFYWESERPLLGSPE